MNIVAGMFTFAVLVGAPNPRPRRLVSIFFPFALLVVFNAAGMI